jgi:hypothetical protein
MPRATATTRRAAISGDIVISKVSGEIVQVSGQIVQVASGAYLASGIYVVTAVTTNISGQVVWVASGEIHVVSGQVVAKVSGEVVNVSGETVVSKVSGEVVDIRVPARLTSGGIFAVGAQSGGVILTSGPCVSVTIKAMSKNSGNIHVGGWWLQSGQGFVLEPGEAVNVDVDNYGRVFLLAEISGDRVTFVGVQ